MKALKLMPPNSQGGIAVRAVVDSVWGIVLSWLLQICGSVVTLHARVLIYYQTCEEKTSRW